MADMTDLGPAIIKNSHDETGTTRTWHCEGQTYWLRTQNVGGVQTHKLIIAPPGGGVEASIYMEDRDAYHLYAALKNALLGKRGER